MKDYVNWAILAPGIIANSMAKAMQGFENEVSKVIEAPFDVNGYEYELIHSTECILEGKTEFCIQEK